MKQQEFKRLIKESVREVFNEELKTILLEAVKGNKQPITESSDIKTFNFTSNSIPHNPNNKPVDKKQAYMDILNETAGGTKSPYEQEFKLTGPVNTMSEGSSLPEGQLSLDSIMNLINK